jgi:hypothetical protein
MAKGCYWNRCLFCEIPLIHNLPGSHCRIKPAQLIVDQLEELSERFNTPYFQFTDESCSPALLEEMADIIKQYGEFFLGGDSFTCPEGMDKRTLHQFISETRKELYQLTDMASKHSGWEEYSLLKICNYENKGAISGRKWG